MKKQLGEISKATIERMPLYLRFLQEESLRGAKYVSSSLIAQNIPVSAVLVRKDLSVVSSVPGKPKIGFELTRLIRDIERFLGYDNLCDAVIVGAGSLGKAFLGYEGFKNNGLNILAAFDPEPKLAGVKIAGKRIYPLEELEAYIARKKVNIGIITAPKEVAQETLDRLVAAGIKAVWNFAPAALKAPAGVIIKNEDLSSSLAFLAGRLKNGL
ncbi:MAG: redox-sensing transcriptional repressor Rex [Clostridia bacterium]|nr:redox-sensing transcriptional repressor Rex [Clostridia bacterium]